jgi:S1-C subfamily serine protease
VDEFEGTRSAKDAALYRSISPSVVLVVTKDSLGSGSLISTTGDILTNCHVVKGAADVGIVFKPAAEGKEPAMEVPKGRNPIHIGDGSDMSVGIDVHAIGHPKGESWTYTKRIVSQYRLAFGWITDKDKHKADVIQTQTPINPGNSGGPLLDDNGVLLGVNTFKASGEGLNFAVSVGEVKRFVGRTNFHSERSEVPTNSL